MAFFDQMLTPQNQALLGLSAGLLSASGPSRTPVGLGSALGQGLLTGANMYNQATQMQMQKQLRDLQMESSKFNLDTAKRSQAAIDSMAAQLPAEERSLFLANPSAYIKSKTEGFTLSPDQVRIQGGKEVARGTTTVRYQDVGNALIPMDSQGKQVGAPIPKTATPGEQARLGFDVFQHQNPSAYQRTQLGNEQARIGMEGLNTYYNTGMMPGGLPAGVPLVGGGVSRPVTPPFAAAPSAPGGLPLSPRAQAEIATAAAKIPAQAQAQAQVDLPQAAATAEQAVNVIDQMIGSLGRDLKPGEKAVPPHPGFSSTVGATLLPRARFVPGTEAANFQAMLDQVKGGAFMKAYETLKGGGQITEVEGAKATAAITRMSTSQSENEFVRAAREFQDVIKSGVERLKNRASGQQAPANTGGWSIRPVGGG